MLYNIALVHYAALSPIYENDEPTPFPLSLHNVKNPFGNLSLTYFKYDTRNIKITSQVIISSKHTVLCIMSLHIFRHLVNDVPPVNTTIMFKISRGKYFCNTISMLMYKDLLTVDYTIFLYIFQCYSKLTERLHEAN